MLLNNNIVASILSINHASDITLYEHIKNWFILKTDYDIIVNYKLYTVVYIIIVFYQQNST